MPNNDPIFNFLKLHGYTGKKLQLEYDRLKKSKITLQQLIDQFVKDIDNNPNSLSCHKCTDRTLNK